MGLLSSLVELGGSYLGYEIAKDNREAAETIANATVEAASINASAANQSPEEFWTSPATQAALEEMAREDQILRNQLIAQTPSPIITGNEYNKSQSNGGFSISPILLLLLALGFYYGKKG